MMEFANREEFRNWLNEHCLSKEGIWLLFGKAGGPETIKAGEALEEALCFGWMDRCSGSMIERIRNIFLCAGKTANGRRKTKI